MRISDLQINQPLIIDYLRKKYNLGSYRLATSDSLLVFDDENHQVYKFPVKQTGEEVYILNYLSSKGINTPRIMVRDQISTELGTFTFYIMENLTDVTKADWRQKGVIKFANSVLLALKDHPCHGYGKITTDSKTLEYQFDNELDFYISILERTARRNYWHKEKLVELKEEIMKMANPQAPVLIHNDIFNNILFQTSTNKYFIIDPQTSVSAANQYWDFSMLMLYCYMNDMATVQSLFQSVSNLDSTQLFLTAKLICYERISFYNIYEPSFLPKMENFLGSLCKYRI